MESTRNPYAGRGSPVSGERLVGRARVLDRLIERMGDQSHCSIVGLPRMGKTSVARECLRIFQARNASVYTGDVSLDAVSGPANAYARILEAGGRGDGDLVTSIARLGHDDAYSEFTAILRKRTRAGETSVVVIDEMDGVARPSFADATLFVARLREVANDRDRYGVTFMFVSRRSLDMIQGAVEYSTLAGLCEVVYLRPLDKEGLAELAARSTVNVHPDGLDRLWYLTGGQPFLAEVVMCEAICQSSGAIGHDEIAEAQFSQAHEFTNQYSQLASILQPDGMFDALCECIVGPRWRPIAPHTMCLLKHYGLVRGEEQPTDGATCLSEHLREYLGLCARTTPTWQLLGETERSLRLAVHDRLVESFGVQWYDALGDRAPQLSDAMTRLREQMVREKRLFGDAASDFLLDYAYIGDLKDIVFTRWDDFRPVLGGAKAEWERIFQFVMKVRNPMAHHRPVPEGVLRDAESSCAEILKRLRDGAGSRS